MLTAFCVYLGLGLAITMGIVLWGILVHGTTVESIRWGRFTASVVLWPILWVLFIAEGIEGWREERRR
jgi:hypothetical protein